MTDPFPMIVGRRRSGTTLVRAMLDSHPAMAIPEEAPFVARMALARSRYELPGMFDCVRFVDDLSLHNEFGLWGVGGEEIARALSQRPPSTFAEAVRCLYQLHAEGQGKTRYGDKTPSAVLHLPLLGALFPESRFLHVIRDGRDVALSDVESGFGSDTLVRAAVYWRRFVNRGRRAGRVLGPDRYREIRYEDLLDDPETGLRSVCAFLSLDFDEQMLRYFERAGEVVGAMAHPEARKHVYLPPTQGLRDWRHQMPAGDLADFEAIAGDLLTDLGYERAVPDPSPAVRLRARRRQLEVEAHRGARRLRRSARKLRRRAGI